MPMPTAGPFTAVTMGAGQSRNRRKSGMEQPFQHPARAFLRRAGSSFMSAPEQKPRPAPVRTSARKAPFSSRIQRRVQAFDHRGRKRIDGRVVVQGDDGDLAVRVEKSARECLTHEISQPDRRA